MTAQDFCYWLQGYFEILGVDTPELDRHQVRVVREHLDLVFRPATPTAVARKDEWVQVANPFGTTYGGISVGSAGGIMTCHAGDRPMGSC